MFNVGDRFISQSIKNTFTVLSVNDTSIALLDKNRNEITHVSFALMNCLLKLGGLKMKEVSKYGLYS